MPKVRNTTNAISCHRSHVSAYMPVTINDVISPSRLALNIANN